jgi:hypothetical protein
MKHPPIKPGQEGVALLMVMSAVAILAFLLANFTFNTKINKLRVYNQLDSSQARLNAEAGLTMALSKLKLYQLGLNALSKNANLKDQISPRDLESAILQPFVFPVPVDKNEQNLIVRNAIAAFGKSVILEGNLSMTIAPVTGFLNPNSMREPPKAPEDEDNNEPPPADSDDDAAKKPPHLMIEQKLLETLTQSLDEQRETNENFDALFGEVEPELRIKEMKYFITEKGKFNDPLAGDIEILYRDAEKTPKHFPFTSKSELYLLQGWTDSLIDLIKDRISVHDVTIIQLNEISKAQLKVLFPGITDDQIKDFFNYRDGNKEEEMDPHPFKGPEDFREAIVNQLGITDGQSYDDRIKEFETAGIKLGVAGKLFKVISQGTFGRSTYNLTAYIDLPLKPQPKPKKKTTTNPDDQGEVPPDSENPDSSGQPTGTAGETPPAPTEYMEPRVVELITGSSQD